MNLLQSSTVTLSQLCYRLAFACMPCNRSALPAWVRFLVQPIQRLPGRQVGIKLQTHVEAACCVRCMHLRCSCMPKGQMVLPLPEASSLGMQLLSVSGSKTCTVVPCLRRTVYRTDQEVMPTHLLWREGLQRQQAWIQAHRTARWRHNSWQVVWGRAAACNARGSAWPTAAHWIHPTTAMARPIPVRHDGCPHILYIIGLPYAK